VTDAAAVSIRNVSKTFGKGGTTALQNIELELRPGERPRTPRVVPPRD